VCCVRYEDQTFRNQELPLDGNVFIRCTIENCTLLYGGGAIAAVNTKLVNIKYLLRDHAAHTLVFLARLRADDPAAFEQLMNEGLQASMGTPSPTAGT
jgi:hypothetical protein